MGHPRRRNRAEGRHCAIDGCGNEYWTRGYCNLHYHRLKKDGVLKPVPRPTVEERFWAKVDKTPTCWSWNGNVLKDGYGMFCVKGKNGLVHRYAYSLLVDEIPDGLQVDHICHNRRCVRPEHLRLATMKQNVENLTGARRTSKSGVRGVWLKVPRNRWYASVCHNGERIFVGEFRELADAEDAVRKKRNELFTHNDADRREQFL